MSETAFPQLRFKITRLSPVLVASKVPSARLLNKTNRSERPPRLLPLADDHQALIWDIQQMPRAIEDPILAYTAEGEINNVQWASTQPDWIAICYNNCLEILRV